MPAVTQAHGEHVVLQRIRPARTRRAARDGDAEVAFDGDAAFSSFFREHFANVTRSIHLIVRDQARAEDICQDAFLQLYRHWPRISGYERPEAWVRRVAIRLAVRGLRRDALWASVRTLFVPRPVDPVVELGVTEAVAMLPHHQRIAVVLFYYEDRPVAEIAALLSCSESTARVHLHRGRHRLAELLREEVSDAAGR